MSLPGTVADIEEEIEKVAAAFGGTEFRDLAGATGKTCRPRVFFFFFAADLLCPLTHY